MPLFRGLTETLRHAILEGALPAGIRLPPTRNAAEILGVSRNTVLSAYEQLQAEGYVVARQGAGTFVADLAHLAAPPAAGEPARRQTGSRRGRELAGFVLGRRRVDRIVPFRPGLPALDELPLQQWQRALNRAVRRLPSSSLSYTDPAGLPELRAALTGYLRLSRGVVCEPEQILIVNGSQEALHLCGLVLAEPGSPAYVEDPGYPGARAAFAAAGLALKPVPVDADGFDTRAAQTLVRKAGLLYTTPSHQFPMGTAMSTARRLEVLHLADSSRSFVIEDDYDSEYRFVGQPLPSLQGLAQRHGPAAERVVYVGTFSKVLFPALRVGYLVVPAALATTFTRVRALLSRNTPAHVQAALTELIAGGPFYRHVKRMRRLYAERYHCIVQAIENELSGVARIVSGPSGMHAAVRLIGIQDRNIAEEAARQGLETPALSELCLRHHVNGLALGFAGFAERDLIAGVRKLAEVIRRVKLARTAVLRSARRPARSRSARRPRSVL